MKKQCYFLFIALLATALAGCVHDDPDGAGNRELTLEWQSEHPDELTDIHLWVFSADGVLKESRTFATLGEARGARLTLPAEQYTLVAATCPASHYSVTATAGKTTLDGLLITLNDASSNPPHIQSGVAKVTADAQTARISLVRVLSELQFTIRNIPSDVVKARAEVLNSACGFYPGTKRLEKRAETVALGEIAVAGGKAEFPLQRMMPVISPAEVRAAEEAEYDTHMAVHLTYADGETLTFKVSAPPMKDNDSYTVPVEYEQLEKDDDTGDRELALQWESEHPDELTDIHLWVFGADGLLKESRTFATLDEAQRARLTPPTEQCTLVAATCPDSYYSLENVNTGETTLDDLFITARNPFFFSNPPHIQSGVAEITAGARTARIPMVRVLSELQLVVRDLPSDIVKARAEVINSTRGFYPGVNRLDNMMETAALGEIDVADGKAEFPLCRLLPVIPLPLAGEEAEYDTRMALHLMYANYKTITFEVSAPPLKNNGSYTASVEYGKLIKDVVLELTPIKDWTQSDPVEGNIELK